MKIIIADDHKLIIEGLRIVVEKCFPDSKVFGVSNKEDLLELLQKEKIDILFQDIKFGKWDARDFLKTLKEEYPDLIILIISSLSNLSVVRVLMNQGANGYLTKSDANEEIPIAVNKVLKGETYISPAIQKQMKSATLKSKNRDSIELTSREKEVLSLILQEKTTSQIADHLFLSPKTIESHRANLFLKFDVKNLVGLIKKAIYAGFI